MNSDITIRVRYNECDPMGVAHHAVYPVWFEMGRTELLRIQGDNYCELESQGLFIVVSELAVHYKKSAKYDDLLHLVTSVDNCSPARISHEYVLRRDSTIIANGNTTLACVNCNGKAQRFPDWLTTT